MFQSKRIEATLPEYSQRDPNAPLALEGIRVLDFSHFLAGPYATMVLADMGAEVIKVEAPERGDNFRHYPPLSPELPGQGGAFLWTNRNKFSLEIDLKTKAGLQVARELVAEADVLIENCSTGVMDRLGLGYDVCSKLNKKLIYCSVSAYGREGKSADRSGFDPIVQAESGFMDMNGYPDRDGVRSGPAVMDISTGAMASNAILGALFARDRFGTGQYIEVALFDTAVTMSGFAVMQYLLTGKVPGRHGNSSPDSSPSGLFHCKDKAFIINCGTTLLFQRLFEKVVNRPDIANDPSFFDRSDRLARTDELFAILEKEFATQTWEVLEPRLRQANVPAGVIRNVAEAMESDVVRDRQLVSRIPHPVIGWLPNVASPIRFSKTPVRDPAVPPAIGEHSEQVLKNVLGYGPEKIQTLTAAGVFGNRLQASAA